MSPLLTSGTTLTFCRTGWRIVRPAQQRALAGCQTHSAPQQIWWDMVGTTTPTQSPSWWLGRWREILPTCGSQGSTADTLGPLSCLPALSWHLHTFPHKHSHAAVLPCERGDTCSYGCQGDAEEPVMEGTDMHAGLCREINPLL